MASVVGISIITLIVASIYSIKAKKYVNTLKHFLLQQFKENREQIINTNDDDEPGEACSAPTEDIAFTLKRHSGPIYPPLDPMEMKRLNTFSPPPIPPALPTEGFYNARYAEDARQIRTEMRRTNDLPCQFDPVLHSQKTNMTNLT